MSIAHHMTQKKSTGYGHVCKDVLQNRNISIYAKAVYSLLCAYAGSTDVAYPSINTIASELGCSYRKCSSSIIELEEFGVIAVERVIGQNSKFRLLETPSSNFRVSKVKDTPDTPAPHAGAQDKKPTQPRHGMPKGSAPHAEGGRHHMPTKNNSIRITDKNNKEKGKRAPKKKKFVRPSIEEVKEYMLSKELSESQADFQSKKFFHHYESNGWKVGKARTPMESWKSSVSGWILRMPDFNNGKQNKETITGSDLTDRVLEDRLYNLEMQNRERHE